MDRLKDDLRVISQLCRDARIDGYLFWDEDDGAQRLIASPDGRSFDPADAILSYDGMDMYIAPGLKALLGQLGIIPRLCAAVTEAVEGMEAGFEHNNDEPNTDELLARHRAAVAAALRGEDQP